MTALLSLTPVVAACYLYYFKKGTQCSFLFLVASLAWCA